MDGELCSADASEPRIFTKLSVANDWASTYASYKFAKGKDIVVVRVDCRYELPETIIDTSS